MFAFSLGVASLRERVEEKGMNEKLGMNGALPSLMGTGKDVRRSGGARERRRPTPAFN